MFDLVTQGMDAPRRTQFCAFVARVAATDAGNTIDPSVRATRAAFARQLMVRLEPSLAAADAALSAEQREAIERENEMAFGLLSYAPSPALRDAVEANGIGDVVGLLIVETVSHCNAMLDLAGVPAAPFVAVDPPSFQWRGQTAEQLFANGGLLPFAAKICIGSTVTSADFAGAPLSQRGVEGMSLLDWAMACADKTAYSALLDANFDATEAGQFGEIPLILAARETDRWYLATLLSHGVPADSAGLRGSALSEAWDPTAEGGGEAYAMLRAAGASLDFPEYRSSMWNQWSIFARWEAILAHWEEFGSDPVALGRSISVEFERDGRTRGNRAALETIRQRLRSQHGVCFPVGPTMHFGRDDRGYLIQPNCPPRS